MARQKVKGISISSANASGTANATSGYALKADGSGGATWSADSVVAGISSSADATAITISSSELVGIGESSPTHHLHVNAGTTNVVAVFESSDNEATIRIKDNTGTAAIKCRNDFRFNTSESTERVRIDSSGRLLTGITSSTSPELGGSNAIGEFVGSASGRLNVLRLSNSYTVSTGTASAAIVFGAHTNGSRDNAVIEVQNTANGGDAIEYQIHLRDNSNSMVENFTMRYDGDIHLNQTRSDSHLYIGSEGGAFGGNSSNWMRASSSSLMFNAPTQHIFEIGGTNKASITSSGGGGIFSDRDMKENIVDIDIGLAEVLQFQPRKFKYKLAADETYGFIAQEVETVVPLIVRDITLPDPDPESSKNTIKTIDTQPIIAALVKSVQELEARIKTLEG